ncbi:MAG: hypothetical protein ACE5F1_13160, partial [Planctomycetota bacterium]
RPGLRGPDTVGKAHQAGVTQQRRRQSIAERQLVFWYRREPTLPLGSFGITYLWLPVLADVINTEDLTLTLAFKTGKLFVASLDPSNRIGVQASGTLIGFGAGLKIRIWDRFALMPEFNIVSPRSSGVADDEIYTVSLGLIF